MSQNAPALAVLVLLCMLGLVRSEEPRFTTDLSTSSRFHDTGAIRGGSSPPSVANFMPIYSITNGQNVHPPASLSFLPLQSDYGDGSHRIPANVVMPPQSTRVDTILSGEKSQLAERVSKPRNISPGSRFAFTDRPMSPKVGTGRGNPAYLSTLEKQATSNIIPIYVIRPPHPGMSSPQVNMGVLSQDRINPEIIRFLKTLRIPHGKIPVLLLAGPVPAFIEDESDSESGVNTMDIDGSSNGSEGPMMNPVPQNAMTDEELYDDEAVRQDTMKHRLRPPSFPTLGKFAPRSPPENWLRYPIGSSFVPVGRNAPSDILSYPPNSVPGIAAVPREYPPSPDLQVHPEYMSRIMPDLGQSPQYKSPYQDPHSGRQYPLSRSSGGGHLPLSQQLSQEYPSDQQSYVSQYPPTDELHPVYSDAGKLQNEALSDLTRFEIPQIPSRYPTIPQLPQNNDVGYAGAKPEQFHPVGQLPNVLPRPEINARIQKVHFQEPDSYPVDNFPPQDNQQLQYGRPHPDDSSKLPSGKPGSIETHLSNDATTLAPIVDQQPEFSPQGFPYLEPSKFILQYPEHGKPSLIRSSPGAVTSAGKYGTPETQQMYLPYAMSPYGEDTGNQVTRRPGINSGIGRVPVQLLPGSQSKYPLTSSSGINEPINYPDKAPKHLPSKIHQDTDKHVDEYHPLTTPRAEPVSDIGRFIIGGKPEKQPRRQYPSEQQYIQPSYDLPQQILAQPFPSAYYNDPVIYTFPEDPHREILREHSPSDKLSEHPVRDGEHQTRLRPDMVAELEKFRPTEQPIQQPHKKYAPVPHPGDDGSFILGAKPPISAHPNQPSNATQPVIMMKPDIMSSVEQFIITKQPNQNIPSKYSQEFPTYPNPHPPLAPGQFPQFHTPETIQPEDASEPSTRVLPEVISDSRRVYIPQEPRFEPHQVHPQFPSSDTLDTPYHSGPGQRYPSHSPLLHHPNDGLDHNGPLIQSPDIPSNIERFGTPHQNYPRFPPQGLNSIDYPNQPMSGHPNQAVNPFANQPVTRTTPDVISSITVPPYQNIPSRYAQEFPTHPNPQQTTLYHSQLPQFQTPDTDYQEESSEPSKRVLPKVISNLERFNIPEQPHFGTQKIYPQFPSSDAHDSQYHGGPEQYPYRSPLLDHPNDGTDHNEPLRQRPDILSNLVSFGTPQQKFPQFPPHGSKPMGFLQGKPQQPYENWQPGFPDQEPSLRSPIDDTVLGRRSKPELMPTVEQTDAQEEPSLKHQQEPLPSSGIDQGTYLPIKPMEEILLKLRPIPKIVANVEKLNMPEQPYPSHYPMFEKFPPPDLKEPINYVEKPEDKSDSPYYDSTPRNNILEREKQPKYFTEPTSKPKVVSEDQTSRNAPNTVFAIEEINIPNEIHWQPQLRHPSYPSSNNELPDYRSLVEEQPKGQQYTIKPNQIFTGHPEQAPSKMVSEIEKFYLPEEPRTSLDRKFPQHPSSGPEPQLVTLDQRFAPEELSGSPTDKPGPLQPPGPLILHDLHHQPRPQFPGYLDLPHTTENPQLGEVNAFPQHPSIGPSENQPIFGVVTEPQFNYEHPRFPDNYYYSRPYPGKESSTSFRPQVQSQFEKFDLPTGKALLYPVFGPNIDLTPDNPHQYLESQPHSFSPKTGLERDKPQVVSVRGMNAPVPATQQPTIVYDPHQYPAINRPQALPWLPSHDNNDEPRQPNIRESSAPTETDDYKTQGIYPQYVPPGMQQSEDQRSRPDITSEIELLHIPEQQKPFVDGHRRPNPQKPLLYRDQLTGEMRESPTQRPSDEKFWSPDLSSGPGFSSITTPKPLERVLEPEKQATPLDNRNIPTSDLIRNIEGFQIPKEPYHHPNIQGLPWEEHPLYLSEYGSMPPQNVPHPKMRPSNDIDINIERYTAPEKKAWEPKVRGPPYLSGNMPDESYRPSQWLQPEFKPGDRLPGYENSYPPTAAHGPPQQLPVSTSPKTPTGRANESPDKDKPGTPSQTGPHVTAGVRVIVPEEPTPVPPLHYPHQTSAGERPLLEFPYPSQSYPTTGGRVPIHQAHPESRSTMEIFEVTEPRIPLQVNEQSQTYPPAVSHPPYYRASPPTNIFPDLMQQVPQTGIAPSYSTTITPKRADGLVDNSHPVDEIVMLRKQGLPSAPYYHSSSSTETPQPEKYKSNQYPGVLLYPEQQPSGLPILERGYPADGHNIPATPQYPRTENPIMTFPVDRGPKHYPLDEKYTQGVPVGYIPTDDEPNHRRKPSVYVYPVLGRHPEVPLVQPYGPQLERRPSGPPQFDPYGHSPTQNGFVTDDHQTVMYPQDVNPVISLPYGRPIQPGYPHDQSRPIPGQPLPTGSNPLSPSGTVQGQNSLTPVEEYEVTTASPSRQIMHPTSAYSESLIGQPVTPTSSGRTVSYVKPSVDQVSVSPTERYMEEKQIQPDTSTAPYAIQFDTGESVTRGPNEKPPRSMAIPSSDSDGTPHQVPSSPHDHQPTEEPEKSPGRDGTSVHTLDFPQPTEGVDEIKPQRGFSPDEALTAFEPELGSAPDGKMISAQVPQVITSESKLLNEPPTGITDEPTQSPVLPAIDESPQKAIQPALLPDSKITRIFPVTKPTFYTDKDGQQFVSLKLLNEPVPTSPSGDNVPQDTGTTQHPKTTDLIIPIGRTGVTSPNFPQNGTQPLPVLKGIPISNVQVFDAQTLIKVLESCNCSNLKFLIPILKRPQSAIVVANNDYPSISN